MNLVAAIAIGIGGMVGAGIFSVLGVAAESSGNALWISFLIGGGVALLSTYSYAKLGAKFPSAGGAVEFLNQGFGTGRISGGINIFMWAGYIIALALYAHAFGGYAATFFGGKDSQFLIKALAVFVVVLFAGVNLLGARTVGKSETIIVAIKVGILVLFGLSGLFFMNPSRLQPADWPSFTNMIFGAGVIFMGYEGFGLVANSAGAMKDPKTMLPRALYLSVFIVIGIYIAVSVSVVGNLSVKEMVATQDYALAEAAKPFLGIVGFKLIAIAALLSTSSAINATLFGAANVCYVVAKDGELPAAFTRTFWGKGSDGLLITTTLVIAFVLLFQLSGIAMMGSAAFLLIYAAVNVAHLRVIDQTGAKKWIVYAAIASCLVMFGFLSVYTYQKQPLALIAMCVLLGGSFGAEAMFRRRRESKRQGIESAT